MKILLTGANGYIGKRLLPVLLEQGHEVICCVRDRRRLDTFDKYKDKVSVFEVDFLKPVDIDKAPLDFDVAFYLIHSLSGSIGKFEDKERSSAQNFVSYINASSAQQIIFLTGIVNEKVLSPHLKSRKMVEGVLGKSSVPLTVLRAGIIVGSGSASFEIIRDLVEKLPIMITPRWVHSKIQPIGVGDVIKFLTGVMLNEHCLNKAFDISGSEVLTYKQLMLEYAEVRHLKRYMIDVPFMTPRLSSYWLYFITSTSYNLAVNLVESMKIDVVAKDKELEKILNIQPVTYKEAVRKAFRKIEENMVVSSWKDSFISSAAQYSMMDLIQVPVFGCSRDKQETELKTNIEDAKDKLWSIGGKNGWYASDRLWKIRGFMDKLVGGVGLRRGRRDPKHLYNGDALDFWRVILSDKKAGRLLLFAEMKLPGEAWLEWKFVHHDDKNFLQQTATFRPKGLPGRLYWYLMLPFHHLIFNKMARSIASGYTEK
jgi:uncharacterized protein YbjT (DUF2867 family)